MATIRASWRLQLRRQVKDPALRRKLVPDYPIGCKRVLFSNDWYPALDRDHVDVVTDLDHRDRADRGAHLRRRPARGRRADLGHRLRRHQLPGADAGHRRRRRRPARAVGRRRPRPPRRGGARVPQPVLRLRPQHQPRRQLDHRDDGGPGRLHRPGRPADRRRRRPADRRTTRRGGRLRSGDAGTTAATPPGPAAPAGTSTGRGSPRTGPGSSPSTRQRLATVDWSELEEHSTP